jgi:pimeloyl-ACP methyl ester carboxylesterase
MKPMRPEAIETLLDVPTGRLRSFVRGSGPTLVLIAGGHGDAARTGALADHLADRYTVVTYDRRGLSGSTPSAPPRTLATHADDLSRLLGRHAAEPVHVYGTSFGGLIALELAATDPGRLGVVIAHEPPVTQLLPRSQQRTAAAQLAQVQDTFLSTGVAAARQRFAELLAIDPTDREPDVEVAAPGPQQLANAEFFLTYDLPLLRRHTVDLAALQASPARIVAGVGQASGGIWPHWCGRLLADVLAVPCAAFPGGHSAYSYRPRATADRIHQVLQDIGRATPAGPPRSTGRSAAGRG